MGKKAVIVWMLAMLLVAALPFASAQDGGSETIYGIVGVDNAEVRAGPDFAYPVIGQLPRNASVVVLGRAGDFFRSWDGRQWLQVNYGENTAWVYARLIRTSTAFNSIPPTGRILPRTQDGRVPDEFDLTYSICDGWQGSYAQSGNFMAGDEEMTVTYPPLQGANMYSAIVIGPDGTRTAFDSETTTAIIELRKLPWEAGIYTWRMAPYWTDSTYRYRWQQVCLLRTGGTFEKPYTGPVRDDPEDEP